MENILNNIAEATGSYNNIPVTITTDALAVTMIDGLKITKTADKMVWAEGLLTYTIVVQNDTNTVYTDPYITDVLDTSLVSFVEDSVYINSEKADTSKYSFDSSTKTLKINLDNIAPSSSSTITFQVKKAI